MTLGSIELPWKPMQSEYGFLVPTAMVAHEETIPPCLAQCLHHANRLHCDYVHFDCDAPAVPGLDTYEW